MNPKKTPKVPKSVRKEAYRCLRHYPHYYDLKKASEAVPHVWGEPTDYYKDPTELEKLLYE